MNHNWPWVVLALLGAYHGLNPGMGWLFALSLGLQEKRRSAVLAALVPIALGTRLQSLWRFSYSVSFNISFRGTLSSLGSQLSFLLLASTESSEPSSARSGHASGWKGVACLVFSDGIGARSRLDACASRVGPAGAWDGAHHGWINTAWVNAAWINAAWINAGGSCSSKHVRDSTCGTGAYSGVVDCSRSPRNFFFESYEKVGLKLLRHTWLNFDPLWAIALLVAGFAPCCREACELLKTPDSRFWNVSGPRVWHQDFFRV